MKLTIVVGTYNRRAQLQRCIDSIFAETETPVCVYVTDAGSTDGTVEYLQSIASERLVPIFVGERLGQARAYNDVFTHVKTPYVCWLSDDNVIINRGVDLAAQVLDEHPSIGMIGLKVKDVAGPFVDAPYIGGVSAIGILNVNQGLLRTPILQEIGGFSERFRDYGIDPDLTAKVLLSGYAVAYTRTIAIHHYRNWNPDPTSPEYVKQMERQKTYLELYQRKYRACAPSGMSRIKKGAWEVIRKACDISVNSSRSFCGLLARDWQNIFSGRYISVLDPLWYHRKTFHLVQSCPPHLRPSVLPPDPE